MQLCGVTPVCCGNNFQVLAVCLVCASSSLMLVDCTRFTQYGTFTANACYVGVFLIFSLMDDVKFSELSPTFRYALAIIIMTSIVINLL